MRSRDPTTRHAPRRMSASAMRLVCPGAVLCAVLGCADQNVDAAAQGGDISQQAEVGAEAFSLDETDKAMIEALDSLHTGMAKHPFWPGFPATTRPLHMVRRSVKGTPKYAFITHVANGSAGAESYTWKGHTVWRTSAGLNQLGRGESAYAYAELDGLVATFSGYSEATLDGADHFIGPLAQASFIRMRELEEKWEAVEGCGVAKYPRNKELIELTLLEDLLLGEILSADAVDLPARMTEFAALRSRRLELEPYTARIDNDGEITFGAPYYARLRVPVVAGLRTQQSVDEELAERLSVSMSVPLEDLDQHLLWKRPIAAAAVLMDAARRLGIKFTPGFKTGAAIHEQWTTANGSGNPADIETVRKRHDSKPLIGRTEQLMAL